MAALELLAHNVRMKNAIEPVSRYAVFGAPIIHSQSPKIYHLFAAQTEKSIYYEARLVPPESFHVTMRTFFTAGGRGANVTAPFKRVVQFMVDQLTPQAQQSGSVNTLLVLPDGRLLGDNTDGVGLVADLHRLRIAITARKILIIGAGGSAYAIMGALLAERPQGVVVVNRTYAKAVYLQKRFSSMGSIQALPFTALIDHQFDLILNATTASFPYSSLLTKLQLLTPGGSCYDLNYGAYPTPFLTWGAQQGGENCNDGLGMLVMQAAFAFNCWYHVVPKVEPVLQILRRTLQATTQRLPTEK